SSFPADAQPVPGAVQRLHGVPGFVPRRQETLQPEPAATKSANS
nr:hypothetical protein [Tanacetum cinerariifolium]